MSEGNGAAPDGTAPDGTSAAGGTPEVVCQIDTAESRSLAALASAFDDLQYVLMCCEHLVTALGSPEAGPVRVATDAALVEALWTGALLGYSRCFAATLTDADVTGLGLGDEAEKVHVTLQRLRDHYASADVNPREEVTIGVALGDDGRPAGVAVLSMPRPAVDEPTVRALGRLAYGLMGLVDGRIGETQRSVLEAATALPADELGRLPQVRVAA